MINYLSQDAFLDEVTQAKTLSPCVVRNFAVTDLGSMSKVMFRHRQDFC